VACTDTWDDHYQGAAQGAHDGTLWEALKGNSNFSNFASVLEACGYDKALGSSQVFTVFAPTNDQLSSAEATALINSYNSQKGSVSDEDNTVVKEFVRNHITLYNHSVSPSTDETLVMMNGKYASLTGTSIGGAPILPSDVNGLYSNGVLYTLGKQVTYGANVFEYLRKDADLDSVASFLYNSRFYRKVFMDDESVLGGYENGRPVYLDSVFRQANELFGSEFLYARLSAEDSTYWMLAPTNQLWKKLIDEYQQYFVYDETVEKSDSVAYTNSRLAIMKGAIFSRTLNSDAALKDSAMSTQAVRSAFRSSYWGEPFLRYYQYGDGLFSQHKPLQPGGVLYGTTNVTCSNGIVMKTDEWNINPLNTFDRLVMTHASGRGSIKELSKVYNASRKDYEETVEAVPVTAVSGSPYYGQLLGSNSFMEFKPGNDTTSVTFNIRNVLSNKGYDIYIVTPPALAADTLATDKQRLPTKLTCWMYYNNVKGEKDSTLLVSGKATTPDIIDYIKLADDFKFPCASFGLEETSPQVTLKVSTNTVSERDLLRNRYTRTMYIAYILLVPHGMSWTDDQYFYMMPHGDGEVVYLSKCNPVKPEEEQ
jgi:uncharacterized surface protein with fasciclin (FAS1) repeats